MQRKKGKFWPQVRREIWAKAQALFQEQKARTLKEDFTGLTAERKELKEGGFYYTAKLLVLRDVNRDKKKLPLSEEETEDADR